MNLPISFTNLNTNTLLLLVGVVILLINVLYGVVRARQNRLKAGWFTVAVMMVACVIVGVGIVGFSTQPRQANGNRFNRNGFGQTTGQFNSQNNFSPTGQIQNIDQPTTSQSSAADPQSTPAANSNSGQQSNRFVANMPPAQQTMVANGQGPEAFQTMVANGDVPPRVMTAVASGQFPAFNGSAANSQANASNGSSAASAGNSSSGSQAPAGFAPPAGFQSPGTAPTPSGAQTDSSTSNSGSQAPAGFAPPSGFQSPSNSSSASAGSSNGGSQATAGFAPPSGFQSPAGTTSGTDNGATGTNSFGGGNFAAGQTTTAIPANLVGNMLAGVGGVLVFFGGFYLYRYERRKPGFAASASRGLLNAGAGFFIVFTAIIVPSLPASISGSSTTTRAQIVVSTAIVTRGNVPTPTPTIAPPATLVPTDLPTLTPTPTDGPLVLATPIQYAYAQPTAVSDCKVTTTSLVNLRGDPSTQNMAIGRVQPGSIVVVTGQSDDNQWLHITYSDGTVSLDGWVSAKYTTPLTGCTSEPSASGTPLPTTAP